MQDRKSANSKKSSCNARPDHTLGSVGPSAMSAQCPVCPRKRPHSGHWRMSQMCHVWTAPSWQGFSSRLQAGRCSHVFGLLARHTRPLAIMPSADQVPVKSPHSTASERMAKRSGAANDHITCRVNAMDLKNRLCDVEADLHIWLLRIVGALTAPTSHGTSVPVEEPSTASTAGIGQTIRSPTTAPRCARALLCQSRAPVV